MSDNRQDQDNDDFDWGNEGADSTLHPPANELLVTESSDGDGTADEAWPDTDEHDDIDTYSDDDSPSGMPEDDDLDADDGDDDPISFAETGSESQAQGKKASGLKVKLLVGAIAVALGSMVGGVYMLKASNSKAPAASKGGPDRIPSVSASDPDPMPLPVAKVESEPKIMPKAAPAPVLQAEQGTPVAALPAPVPEPAPEPLPPRVQQAQQPEPPDLTGQIGVAPASVPIGDVRIEQIERALVDIRFQQEDASKKSEIVASSVVKAKAITDNHEQRIADLAEQVAVLLAWREEILVQERAEKAAQELARLQAEKEEADRLAKEQAEADEKAAKRKPKAKPAKEKAVEKPARKPEQKKTEPKKAEPAPAKVEAKKAASTGVKNFVVVATYPSTTQPGMQPERAWVTDGQKLVEVKVGSVINGAKVTGISGTTVTTSAGSIKSAN